MPKKNWTDEERKAFGAKMKAARNKNKNPQNETVSTVTEETVTETVTQFPNEQPAEEAATTIADSGDYEALLRRIQELESMEWRRSQQNQQPVENMGQGLNTTAGRVTGTFEKYPVAADYYPDHRARLSAEAKLQRFAFPMNYELEFEINESAYTTIDGIRTKEPKFTLGLIRIILDEETGDPTNGRYTICRLVMHEDPDAALTIAREQGLNLDGDNDERDFLNEMRYLRMRDWLIECFYPPKPAPEKNKRDMVIDGKLVEYFEVQSETTQTVPFGELKTKL